ncbi:MAG: hypothetical protein ACAI25_09625, partial [Planctomycetota bacterium]
AFADEKSNIVPVPASRLAKGRTLLLPELSATFAAPSNDWQWTELKTPPSANLKEFRCQSAKEIFAIVIDTTPATPATGELTSEDATAFAERVMRPYSQNGSKVTLERAEPSSLPKPDSFRVVAHTVGTPKGATKKVERTYQLHVSTSGRRFCVYFGSSVATNVELMTRLATAFQGARAPQAAAPAPVAPVASSGKEKAAAFKAACEAEDAKLMAGLVKFIIVVGTFVLVGGTVAFVTQRRAAPYKVVLPFAQVRHFPEVCVLTGEKEDLDLESFKFSYTSSAGAAIGLISMVSIFTGGIIYTPGRRTIDLDLPLSAEGRRLMKRARIIRPLNLIGTIGLLVLSMALGVWFGFVAALLGIVAAVVVPVTITTRYLNAANVKCLHMSEEAITLQFPSKEVALEVRTATAPKAAIRARGRGAR